ncbi:inversin isoform X2 [Tiliqua scincoides]|uniref:inversin isoform X2 n=1 Tax=Tiliqua scincoides TaxID=71010 RepID=UPI00346284A6
MNASETLLFSGSSLASQVHAAAVNGHKSALLKQIAGNPDLKDKEDQFGRTPLMYCVLADRLDCAEALLKTGTDVNKADHSQRTALHLAAQKGNYRFMKLLLARRANWVKKDLEEITPLHLTTRHKSPKCLALLLKYLAPGEVDIQDKNKDAAPTESLLNWQDYEGRTPLHFAVADGNVAVVDLLTSYEGCNVTSYDNLFRTPLHWAALLGHAQIVQLLLDRNKFGTIPSDSQGATPLHYAAQSNFAETVEAFLKHPSVKDDTDLEGRTSFMWAAGKGSNDVIRTMLNLKLDIDINMADKYGGTALHAAALSGHVSTVQLLLKYDAQVDATDVMKHTPLFRACEMGHKEVIQTLIKGGARVDLLDQDGHSPLHWAALGGNPDVCQILIENKINPNVQDYAGRTPLQCAAYGGYINCMVVLLENNADPNIQDKEGRTALHWLCNNGYLDAIKLLLGFGAFPNHMENNEERYTPLDYALLGAHHEVIQFMLEHGALSIAAIQDIAAVKIQAVYKGYKVRKAFQDRKNLLMKHEQLRKDAAAKKREEENRRKATGLQKEMQNAKISKVQVQQQDQQCLSEREKSCMTLLTPQHSIQQGDAHCKRPPSGSRSQNQPGKSRRSSSTVLPKKATARDKCNSKELPCEDHKRKKEISRIHSKSKSACVPSHSYKEKDASRHQVEAKHQTISATSGMDCKKHKEPTPRTKGTFRHSSTRPDSSSKAASSGEKSEDQSQSINSCVNHCAETAACVQNSNCTNRSTRTSRQCEMAFKGSPQPLKARNEELNAERWSPAGSSRPGSAKVGNVNIRRDSSSMTLTQTNKVTHNDVTRKACPLLTDNARTTRLAPNRQAIHNDHGGNPKLCRQTLMVVRNPENQLSSLQHKGPNIELVPLELRMQVIEKERARKELFREKNCAAAIIQRTWRSYRLRRQFLQLLHAMQQCKEDEDKWRLEMATFCIEVAWKKQLNRTSVKPVSSGKSHKSTNKSSPTVHSMHKPSTLKQIYGHSSLLKVHKPTRPHSLKQKLSELQMLSASGLQYVCLLENTGKFEQFSYNMKSTTAIKTKHTKSRHESRTEL